MGPSQRSDFGLLNSGCADVVDGRVPGREWRYDQDWDVAVKRSGRLEVSKKLRHSPFSVRVEELTGAGLYYADGRWQQG